MDYKVVGLAGIAIFCLLCGCTQEPAPEEGCSLSLCDCKCHLESELPEKDGRLCGINCLGEYGVKGCAVSEGKCVEVYLDQNDSRKIAEEYVANAPTYSFDGYGLELVEETVMRCPFCWGFLFKFESSHAGYGDRSGQIVAEVVTSHTVMVMVEKGSVQSAIIDGLWDEKNQEYIRSPGEKTCSYDSECAIDESRCPDGTDPYHVCSDGVCTQVVYVRDPCLDRVCPKGDWVSSDENSCFTYANCAKTGCDDGSDSTIDACVNVGSRSEGCRYTLREAASNDSCSKDTDCVPSQCCHPDSCVNREYGPDCKGVMCTMSCEGPIDCGAGSCGCVEGKCSVVAANDTQKII